MERLGHRVVMAADGPEALEMVRQSPPDLVLGLTAMGWYAGRGHEIELVDPPTAARAMILLAEIGVGMGAAVDLPDVKEGIHAKWLKGDLLLPAFSGGRLAGCMWFVFDDPPGPDTWCVDNVLDLLHMTQATWRAVELSEARRLADEASQVKGRFLSRMSHEIRTPLNVILGFVELLMAQTESSKQREMLEAVHQNAYRLGLIIDDVLDMSRMDDGRLELHLCLARAPSAP